MTDSDYVYINKHIDSLPMFLNWEIDVILSFLLCFYSGIIFANSFWGLFMFLLLGIMVGWIYGKIKNSAIKGYFKHIQYMLNFREPKTLIPSYKRRFLGA